MALCEVKGWTPVGYYIDNDRSASNGKERPEWDRLLADIKAGRIDSISAWDQDRGWRMMHELEDLRKFFTGLGRRVPLATTGQGDIDLYSPTGVLAAQIKTAVSEHEVAMLKVRIRRAARAKAEKGKPQWRKAFGYLPETRPKEEDDGVRQPDPETGPMVADAYKAILAGTSISDIARDWNAQGKYGLNGNPWTPSTMSLFLRAARNAGLRSHNDEIVGKATWPGLVDESTWRAVQTVLNAPGRAPGRKTVRKHLLTGVLHCGNAGCGGTLAGQWVMLHPTGRKPGRRKAGEPLGSPTGQTAHRITYGCKKCHGVSVRAEMVEPLLLEWVQGRLTRPDAVDLLKAAIHDEAAAEATRRELNALNTELDNIGVERAEGLLTGKQAKIASDIIAAKIHKLERCQQDAERVRVFDGIPLGQPEAARAVEALSSDRYRAVIDVLMAPTVLPVGKGGNAFNPRRVKPNWHHG